MSAFITLPSARRLAVASAFAALAAPATARAAELPVDVLEAAHLASYAAYPVLSGLGLTALIVAFVLISLDRGGGAVARWAGWFLSLIVAVPVGGLLSYLVPPPPDTAAILVRMCAWAFALWIVVVALTRSAWFGRLTGGASASLWTIVLLSALTGDVILLDQWTGGSLSRANVLSYNPIEGARLYGLGNENAAMLAGVVLVVFGATWELAGEHATIAGRPLRRVLVDWALPIVATVSVITSAAPTIGANVTVLGWMSVSFFWLWVRLSGRRMTWRAWAVFGASVIALLGALIVIDLARPVSSHLGAAAKLALSGDTSALAALISRKVAIHADVMAATPLTYVFAAFAVWVAWQRSRASSGLARLAERRPAFDGALAAALLGGAIAFFTEDSGIIIPALMFIYVGGAVACAAAAPQPPELGGSR